MPAAQRSPGAFWQDAEVAAGFIDERRRVIPLLDAQEELITRLITRRERAIRRFVDLGAGAGALSELVLRAHPGSTGLLVDFSEPMLEAAERRLAAYRDRWEPVRADLATSEWLDALPAGERFDAVVSGLCIHHLPDERKRGLYGEAFDLLKPGGLLLNWEHVSGGGLAEGLFEEYMVERLVAAEQERPHPRSSLEVEQAFQDRYGDDGDILLDVDTQCGWLREIGFEQVDTYFKLPELAVFGGVRGGG